MSKKKQQAPSVQVESVSDNGVGTSEAAGPALTAFEAASRPLMAAPVASVAFEEFIQIGGKASKSYRAVDGYHIDIRWVNGGCWVAVQPRESSSVVLVPFTRAKGVVMA